MDKDSVVRPPGGAHNAALVDIFDVTGLHGESIDDDGEVRYLTSIFFESLGAFDCIGALIRVEAMLEVFDGGLTAGSDGIEIGTVFGFLRCESFRKSTIPSCLGRGQGLFDTLAPFARKRRRPGVGLHD